MVTIADFTAAAHGVRMSHGAPADDTGAAVGASADPLALHGLAIAVTLAGEGRLRVPVAAAYPLAEAEAAHELGEPPRPRKDRAGELTGRPWPVTTTGHGSDAPQRAGAVHFRIPRRAAP